MDNITLRPPSLRETQQWMAAHILRPERSDTDELARVLVQPPRGHCGERLGVYVSGYPARVQEAVEESFPAVAHIIGHRATHGLIGRYLTVVTRHTYNLNDVGAKLPSFLRSDPLTDRFPFLPDLAVLEWAVARAFHAYDQPPLDPAPLAAWTEAQWQLAVLQFHPSVALVSASWPIRELWEARETSIEEIDIDMRDRPDHVLVRRAGCAVHCESLSDDEAAVLAALVAGCTLGQVSEALMTRGGNPAAVATWFARWMHQRLLIGCSSAPAGYARERGKE
jgi:Putative DNA-binding domain